MDEPQETMNPNPLAEERAKGGPPRQSQEWPGREDELRPHADHGEESYRGSEKLVGRVALITGGDSGIGRAIAIAFAREGADVAIAYYSEHDDAQETVRWIEKAGRRAKAIAGDLSDPEHCRRVIEETRSTLGALDILVNNAAVHVDSEFGDIPYTQLEQTFRTNFFAPFVLIQTALPHLSEGASIINTGSVTGLEGNPVLPDYAATKASLHNLTKSLAPVLAERGIRINCVAPGPVWTPLIASTREEKRIENFGSDTFWKRPAQPAELAPSFVFLASADSRYYTGEIMAPTGTKSSTR